MSIHARRFQRAMMQLNWAMARKAALRRVRGSSGSITAHQSPSMESSKMKIFSQKPSKSFLAAVDVCGLALCALVMWMVFRTERQALEATKTAMPTDVIIAAASLICMLDLLFPDEDED